MVPSLSDSMPFRRRSLLKIVILGDNGLISSELLLSFCPSVHVPVGSSDLGKSFDLEDKASEILRTDSEDKSSNSSVSWNIGDSNNSDEALSSLQSISYPITKKNKKKKKVKKRTTQQQQKQKQKKICSWLCCKYTGPCFPCCKRLKCCSCCCGLPKWCWSSRGWLFCCHWCCFSSSSKKMINDEMT